MLEQQPSDLLGVECQDGCLISSEKEERGHFSSHDVQPGEVHGWRGGPASGHRKCPVGKEPVFINAQNSVLINHRFFCHS